MSPLPDAAADPHGSVGLPQGAHAADREVIDNEFEQVYGELRRLAHHRLLSHRPSATLNTTALVHEAYVKLADQSRIEWRDRAHFFALASRAMRFVLVDYARVCMAQKRGGGRTIVPLQEIQIAAEERAADLLALDDALERLNRLDGRLSRMVEYRYFGGLSYDEIAEVTGMSVPTVKRDWSRARAWLYRAIQQTEESSDG